MTNYYMKKHRRWPEVNLDYLSDEGIEHAFGRVFSNWKVIYYKQYERTIEVEYVIMENITKANSPQFMCMYIYKSFYTRRPMNLQSGSGNYSEIERDFTVLDMGATLPMLVNTIKKKALHIFLDVKYKLIRPEFKPKLLDVGFGFK